MQKMKSCHFHRKARSLSEKIGERAYDTGAHGHAMGYQYNGRLRSAEVLLCEDGSTRLIRRAETPEDYFATAIWE